MTEETAPGATPESKGATPETTGAPASATETGEELGPSGKAALDKERTARETAEKAARKAQKELDDFRKSVQTSEEAKLSETDRLSKRMAQLERDLADRDRMLQERTVSVRTLEAATRLGFRNPELAHKLLDQSELEYTEDGQPKNVEKLLRALLERESYLGKASGDFGGGNRGTTPSATANMDDLLRAAVKGG